MDQAVSPDASGFIYTTLIPPDCSGIHGRRRDVAAVLSSESPLLVCEGIVATG